jgi:hypothetical protein
MPLFVSAPVAAIVPVRARTVPNLMLPLEDWAKDPEGTTITRQTQIATHIKCLFIITPPFRRIYFLLIYRKIAQFKTPRPFQIIALISIICDLF